MIDIRQNFNKRTKELNLNRKQKILLTKEEEKKKKFLLAENKINNFLFEKNKINNKEDNNTMNEDLNIIYYGPAGTGKTREALQKVEELTGEEYITTSKEKNDEIAELENRLNFLDKKSRKTADEKQEIKDIPNEIKKLEAYPLVEFTTFHPSYQYQEFIEGITIREENKKTIYEIKDGIFKKISQRALDNPDENYVLIIDEINRGNISSIFGEFFTLLEDTKRVYSSEDENYESVSITLPYSQEKLSVPDNLYIIGTMNTTDKSISLLDVALRRRFKFIAVEPNYDILVDIENFKLSNMLQSINKRLAVLKGEDFQIGHSYFLDANSIKDLQNIFEFKIIPLLKEYFHSDWESICAVLNQDYQVIEENGLLINKFIIQNNLFKDNSKFAKIITKKKTLMLNTSFTISNLESII